VLLVDDEPDLLDIFGTWLERAGFGRVYTAKDGEAALAVIKEHPIDLLVTDVRMPVMDGITLVRHLAGLGKSIPGIVFISGFGDIDQREMYGLGVEAFLTKPVPPELLIEVAERALEERSSLWATPMGSAPRQSLEIRVQRAGEAAEQEPVRLGRGGFSTHYAGTITLGKVAFHCDIGSGNPEMIGEGYVRWRSRSDDKVGVEFAFLDSSCRSWVLDEIAGITPISFIPSLR
jgi:CheY-like chemotaxis protein